jgi:hypothetical protein
MLVAEMDLLCREVRRCYRE